MHAPKETPVTDKTPIDALSQHTRRDFLGVAATAAGGGGALASMASAREATGAGGALGSAVPKAAPRLPVKDGEPVRMGIIGTGGMGTGHCEAFLTLHKDGKEKVQIVALCDVCQPRLETALSKTKALQPDVAVETYGDYRTLLARTDLHGVLIATPEHQHASIAIDALLAGKDVYLEKPMTLRLEEALRLREVVLANPDLRLQVGTQMTNLPRFHEARKALEAGAIGKAVSSQTSYCRNSKEGEWQYYEIDPLWKPGVNVDWEAWLGHMPKREWDPLAFARWRRYKDFSTGIVGDLLVHVVTPMLVALKPGWPTRVVASGGHYVDTAMENHDQVNLNIEFESGHTMIVSGSTCNEVGLETLIRGHQGNIYLGGRNCVIRPERIFAEDADEKTIDCPDIGNDQDLHRLKWLKCVRTREQPDSDVEQGAKVMVIVDLATRSMWDGGAYAFDPKTLRARRV